MPTVLEVTDLTTCPERDRMSSTAVTETTGDTETIMTGEQTCERPGTDPTAPAYGRKDGDAYTVCLPAAY